MLRDDANYCETPRARAPIKMSVEVGDAIHGLLTLRSSEVRCYNPASAQRFFDKLFSSSPQASSAACSTVMAATHAGTLWRRGIRWS